MPMSTGGGLGTLVGTLLRAYLQGRGERTQEQQFRDVFTRMMSGMGGADAGPKTRDPGLGTFSEQDLGTDGAAAPPQAIRRTGSFVEPTPRPKLPGIDESGATQGPASSPFFRPMPTQEPGLWGALKGVGSDLLAGLTPGDQYGTERALAMLSLQEKLKAIYQQNQQQAMLRRMMGLEVFKRSLGPTEEQQASIERSHAGAIASKASADLSRTRTGQVGKAKPLNALEQAEYDYAQAHGYKMGTGPGTAKGAVTAAQINASVQKLTQMKTLLSPGELGVALETHNAMVRQFNHDHPELTPFTELAPEDVVTKGVLWNSSRPGVTQKKATQDPSKMTNEELLKALGQ